MPSGDHWGPWSAGCRPDNGVQGRAISSHDVEGLIRPFVTYEQELGAVGWTGGDALDRHPDVRDRA